MAMPAESFTRRCSVRLIAQRLPIGISSSQVRHFFAKYLDNDNDDKLARVGFVSICPEPLSKLHDFVPGFFSTGSLDDALTIVRKTAGLHFDSTCSDIVQVEIIHVNVPQMRAALCVRIGAGGDYRPLLPMPIRELNVNAINRMLAASRPDPEKRASDLSAGVGNSSMRRSDGKSVSFQMTEKQAARCAAREEAHVCSTSIAARPLSDSSRSESNATSTLAGKRDSMLPDRIRPPMPSAAITNGIISKSEAVAVIALPEERTIPTTVSESGIAPMAAIIPAPETPKPGIWFDAKITWLADTERVAVVPSARYREIAKLSDDLDACVRNNPTSPDSLKVGAFAAAPFQKLYYRARIIESSGRRTCQVYFVDYGNYSTVERDAISAIPLQFCSTPAAALQVDLSAAVVGGGHPTSSGIDARLPKPYDNACSVKLLAKVNDRTAADVEAGIVILSDGIDLRSLLYDVDASSSRVMEADVPYPEVTGKLRAATVAGVSAFDEKRRLLDVVVDDDDNKTLAKALRKSLKLLEEEMGVEALRTWPTAHRLYVGEMCLAPYVSGEKSRYRRALVESVDDAKSSVSVFYIDYGRVRAGIAQGSIRPMPKALVEGYARCSLPLLVNVVGDVSPSPAEAVKEAGTLEQLLGKRIDVDIDGVLPAADGSKLFRARVFRSE